MLNHPTVYNHSAPQETFVFPRGFRINRRLITKAIHIQLMVSIGCLNTLNFSEKVQWSLFTF